MNIGPMIDKLWKLKEKQKAADKLAEAAAAEFKAFEAEVAEVFRTTNTPKASGRLANFSIKPAMLPNVTNWYLFYGYIFKNKAGYLLERRPTALACRELFDSKGIKLKEDGTLVVSKAGADFQEKYGLTPFVKFSTHLTQVKS
jgi:hypothetical protein